ncbi:MAG: hypothetical protein MJ061_05375 [Mailhella sp.]|nr:hypothetical protein [Mailhella sp.]
MNQGIELDSAVVLTIICTLIYLGAVGYRKWKDKGARPGSLTYWQDGEQHTIDVGFLKEKTQKPRARHR